MKITKDMILPHLGRSTKKEIGMIFGISETSVWSLVNGQRKEVNVRLSHTKIKAKKVLKNTLPNFQQP